MSEPDVLDERAIRAVVHTLEEGWNSKRSVQFASPFAENADFVTIHGLHVQGRQAIDKGHQELFTRVYKDSTISLAIEQIRAIRPDIALVHVQGQNVWRQNGGETTYSLTISLVVTKDADEWQIVSFQNTKVEQPSAGKPN